MEGSTG